MNKKTKIIISSVAAVAVVAIIAVLVAIAIPIFNKQLEKSREAYDIATMRQAASAAVEQDHNLSGNLFQCRGKS